MEFNHQVQDFIYQVPVGKPWPIGGAETKVARFHHSVVLAGLVEKGDLTRIGNGPISQSLNQASSLKKVRAVTIKNSRNI